MPAYVVGAALAAYAAALFGVGWWAQRAGRARFDGAGLVTALSIGVYCTSWTFYGAVGSAARSGWDYLPIYLGPILAFTFGLGLIRRTVALGKGHGATSLPDLLSRRFGRSPRLASLASLTLVLVSIPYIALQLIAVSTTFAEVTGLSEVPTAPVVIGVTGVLAAFGLLFGTRNRDATEKNPGLVGAMAFDSVFKLAAFSVVAFLALGYVLGSPEEIAILPDSEGFASDRFLVLTLLSGFMMLCLPRQFHMTVVEARDQQGVGRAAPWAVGYFALFAVLVLPLAAAGAKVAPGSQPDLFVLTIPEVLGYRALELLAFTGGFAAAAGMIVVAGVALSAMLATDIVLPIWSRRRGEKVFGRALTVRRMSLAGLLTAAALFALVVPGGAFLAELGVVAFAGAGQLAPLLLAALFLPQVPERAAFWGLLCGAVAWLVLVLAPAFFPNNFLDASALADALLPFLSDTFTRGAVLSLIVNGCAMGAVTWLSTDNLQAKEAAARFQALGETHRRNGEVSVPDLRSLLVPIIGEDECAELIALHGTRGGKAGPELLAAAETKLSRVLGNASANIILTRLLSSGQVDAGDVMILMGDASRELRFGQELLSATLENLAEAVSVIDREGRLVAWNRAYTELFGYPEELVKVGGAVSDLIRHNLPHLDDRAVEKRVAHLRQGLPHTSETILRDGRILRIQGRPVPGGGYVTSFSDVTEYREAQAALVESERATRFYTDNVPFPIAFSDRAETIRFHNKAYAAMTGRAGEDLTGRNLRDLLGDGYGLRGPSIEAVLGGQERRFVLSPEEIGGATTWQVTYVPQVTDSGSVVGFFGFYQDISKRRAAQAALEEANRTLEARVEERTAELRAANAAADSARQEAETANRSKTRFLAAASHDVLQPLNAARLFASSLEDSLGGQAEPADMARKIGTAIVSADTLLRSLLNLSKIEAGGVDPRPETLALGPYLKGIAEEFGPLAAEKGLALRLVDTSLSVRTDPGLLRSAIQNLVSNALRYTDEGGVLLGVRRRGDRVHLEVIDTGRGIEEESIPTIFDEFSRLQRDLDIDGAGLGLATVRRVADLLGHEVVVSSRPERGTVFRISLPRVTARSAPSPRPAPGTADFEGRHVLCVDNDRAVLDALKTRFKRWGATVSAHRSVSEVKASFENGSALPDLLVLDYQLDAGETGLDVLKFLREEKGASCPVIVVTASRSPETDSKLLDAGVEALAKPVEPAALRALSISLLGGRKG